MGCTKMFSWMVEICWNPMHISSGFNKHSWKMPRCLGHMPWPHMLKRNGPCFKVSNFQRIGQMRFRWELFDGVTPCLFLIISRVMTHNDGNFSDELQPPIRKLSCMLRVLHKFANALMNKSGGTLAILLIRGHSPNTPMPVGHVC